MVEKFWYESKPFLYFALAAFAIKGPYASGITNLSGSILILCGTTVLCYRLKARGLL